MSNNCGGAPNAKASSGIPDSAWEQQTVTDVWDIFYGHGGCGVCGVSAKSMISIDYVSRAAVS